MTDRAPDAAQSSPSSAELEPITDEMLQLLVCPVDHARLDLDGDVLVCQTCGRRYPIEDGVPNMLVDDI